jgi:hypothetical protein
MRDNQKPLERIVLTRLMRLNATISGIVVGLLSGLTIFVATMWLVLKGGPPGPEGEPVVGPHLALLGQFFIGYDVTFAGSLIGFAYGFVTGFVVGYSVARIYNWLVGLKEDRSSG